MPGVPEDQFFSKVCRGKQPQNEIMSDVRTQQKEAQQKKKQAG